MIRRCSQNFVGKMWANSVCGASCSACSRGFQRLAVWVRIPLGGLFWFCVISPCSACSRGSWRFCDVSSPARIWLVLGRLWAKCGQNVGTEWPRYGPKFRAQENAARPESIPGGRRFALPTCHSAATHTPMPTMTTSTTVLRAAWLMLHETARPHPTCQHRGRA